MDCLEKEYAVYNTKQFQCSVLQICNHIADPIDDKNVYGTLIENCAGVVEWLLIGETNQDGIFHVHALCKTGSRSDAFKRSIASAWDKIKIIASKDIGDPDATMEILKSQKCHKPSSMIQYMCKNPSWIMSNSKRLMSIVDDTRHYKLSERFIKSKDTDQLSMNQMTKEITDIIIEHNCKTFEDCIRCAPEIMSKYLHRSGLLSIVSNCLTFVKASGATWKLTNYCKFTPNPEKIHKVLLHQGINPTDWDLTFHQWITKKDPKRNTLVLFGASNTGKSATISGFKQCVPWGEVVNSNSFAFEGLIDAGFGIWEEPLISPELAEKAKQIFEGMPCSIPVKYKKPHLLPRVPILMTTNHVPWRFCTKEEPMFKNRMIFWHFRYDMTDGIYVCRTVEHNCKCNSCKGSRSSTSSDDNTTTAGMQGTEQSLHMVGDPNETGNVGTGSMLRTDGSSEGSNCRASSSSSGSTDITSAYCSGSLQCSSSSDEYQLRSGREHGSGYTRIRRSHPRPKLEQCLVSDGHRRSPTGDVDGDRETGGGGTNPKNDMVIGRPRSRSPHHKKMVMLDNPESQMVTDNIETQERALGGDVATMTVPTKTDWQSYFSFLYMQYKDD